MDLMYWELFSFSSYIDIIFCVCPIFPWEDRGPGEGVWFNMGDI